MNIKKLNNACGFIIIVGFLFSAGPTIAQKDSKEQISLSDRGIAELQKSNMIEAIEILKQADKKGELKGTAALAEIYHSGAEYDTAYPLYQKCAAEKILDCQLRLIRYMEIGLGGTKIDKESAFIQLKKLVNNKQAPAELYYAEVLEHGRLGVNKDESQALSIIKRLAKDGHRPSIIKLSEAYKVGALGLTKDKGQYNYWKQLSVK